MSLPRIWPGRALALAALIPALLSLGVFVSDAVQPAVLALDLLVAAIALADLAEPTRGRASSAIVRECGTTARWASRSR